MEHRLCGHPGVRAGDGGALLGMLLLLQEQDEEARRHEGFDVQRKVVRRVQRRSQVTEDQVHEAGAGRPGL